MKIRRFLSALALAGLSSAASAATFLVDAHDNSTSGGIGVSTLSLLSGQQFSVSVAADDLWNAGALPRWSNADGLIGNLYASPSTDPQALAFPGVLPGTLIGSSFGLHSQGGLSAAFGTLVGQIDNGNFFKIGTSFTGVAGSSGTLKLFYFDSNNGDNTGSIAANVSAVPEPETYAMLLAGFGLIAGMARRRRAK